MNLCHAALGVFAVQTGIIVAVAGIFFRDKIVSLGRRLLGQGQSRLPKDYFHKLDESDGWR